MDEKIAKVANQTAKALEKTERKATLDLRSTYKRVIEAASIDLLRNPSREHLTRSLPAWSQQLENEVAQSLAFARQGARDASRKQHEAELALLLLLLYGASPEAGVVGSRSIVRIAEDDAHAKTTARSLATAWAAYVLTHSRKVEKDVDRVRVVATSVQPMQARADRAAVTEAVDAFNRERQALVEEAKNDGAPWTEDGLQEWNAVLDRYVCERCRAMDGRRVAIGSLFPGGFFPPMHPHCRCFVILVPKKIAAAA